jgi:hypothetical protein
MLDVGSNRFDVRKPNTCRCNRIYSHGSPALDYADVKDAGGLLRVGPSGALKVTGNVTFWRFLPRLLSGERKKDGFVEKAEYRLLGI